MRTLGFPVGQGVSLIKMIIPEDPAKQVVVVLSLTGKHQLFY